MIDSYLQKQDAKSIAKITNIIKSTLLWTLEMFYLLITGVSHPHPLSRRSSSHLRVTLFNEHESNIKRIKEIKLPVTSKTNWMIKFVFSAGLLH